MSKGFHVTLLYVASKWDKQIAARSSVIETADEAQSLRNDLDAAEGEEMDVDIRTVASNDQIAAEELANLSRNRASTSHATLALKNGPGAEHEERAPLRASRRPGARRGGPPRQVPRAGDGRRRHHGHGGGGACWPGGGGRAAPGPEGAGLLWDRQPRIAGLPRRDGPAESGSEEPEETKPTRLLDLLLLAAPPAWPPTGWATQIQIPFPFARCGRPAEDPEGQLGKKEGRAHRLRTISAGSRRCTPR